MIIPCIHIGTKTELEIKYKGVKQKVSACNDCVNIIKESKNYEVVS